MFLLLYLLGCFAAYLLLRNIHMGNEDTIMTFERYQNDDDQEMLFGMLLSWITVIALLLRSKNLK